MNSEKYQVLLVEDNPGDARLVKEFLGEDAFESFELDHVQDMQTALLHLLDNEPQVVLLDLGLPDSRGIQTLEILYQHNPKLPIVVLTGMDQEELGIQAVREGAQDYLSKSILDGRILIRSLHFAIQRKANEERMRELLRHDLLTELPNRRALREELSSRIHSGVTDSSIGILFINLDQFKLLNENYGNRAADSVLKAVGERLKGSFRELDFVSRIDRDEFVVLTRVNTATRASSLATTAEQTLKDLSQPIALRVGEKDLNLHITGSIGVANHTPDGIPGEGLADRLIGNAETAMKKAKSVGGNHCHYFDEQLNTEAQARVRIASGLQNALKSDEFDLNYQPIVDAQHGNIFGYEVLLRWNPKVGESVSPDEFIPILEASFQIVSVGQWVMDRACSDYRKWVDQGLLDDATRLFINFSPPQFMDANLQSYTLQLMERYRIPRGVLHFEITENLLLSTAETVLDQLAQLKQLGVSIAIDDFGSGFSSMNYLKDMPCDFLKIDKSFVRDMEESERNRVIASAIIHLGESLGIGVIAEGVETREGCEQLLEWYCHIQQGFYHARPMTKAKFENWLGTTKPSQVANN